MYLLINGPFGVGKSTAARVVTRRLRATLYNPEHVGLALRLLRSRYADFQDDPRWPAHVVTGARVLSVFSRALVIPMTLWKEKPFEQVVCGLRRLGPVVCVVLTASESVLRHRIARDNRNVSAAKWRLAHVDQCLAAFTSEPRFGFTISTDNLDASAVADQVISIATRA